VNLRRYFYVTAFSSCSAPREQIVEPTPDGMFLHRPILQVGAIASEPSRLAACVARSRLID
jgi:hypothetical protein